MRSVLGSTSVNARPEALASLRPRPAFAVQAPRHLHAGDMDDDRIMARPAFHFEDLCPTRSGILRVGGQP